MESPTSDGGRVSIVLLDDHDLVRQGVADLINAQPDLRVIGQAGTAAGVIELIARLRPDLAVLDVRLDENSGIEVCRHLNETMPDVRCIMLTSINDDRTILKAAEAGAVALVLKRVRGDELLEAVRKVMAGLTLLDAATVRCAQQRLKMSQEGLVEDLSPQEQRLFTMLGEGFSNRQSAEAMNLTADGEELRVKRPWQARHGPPDTGRCTVGTPRRTSPRQVTRVTCQRKDRGILLGVSCWFGRAHSIGPHGQIEGVGHGLPATSQGSVTRPATTGPVGLPSVTEGPVLAEVVARPPGLYRSFVPLKAGRSASPASGTRTYRPCQAPMKSGGSTPDLR